jgi:hypothetical protein
MKSILINPHQQTILEVLVTADNVLKETYAMLNCSLVETVCYLPNFDAVIGDEEAHYNEKQTMGFYIKNGNGQTMYVHGNAIVWGLNFDTGENDDCNSDVEYIKSLIEFVDFETSQAISEEIKNSPTQMFFTTN